MDIHGPLQTRGENRFPGGVSVSCLATLTKLRNFEKYDSQEKSNGAHAFNCFVLDGRLVGCFEDLRRFIDLSAILGIGSRR